MRRAVPLVLGVLAGALACTPSPGSSPATGQVAAAPAAGASRAAPQDGAGSRPSPAAPAYHPRSFTLLAGGDVLIYASMARQAQREAVGRGHDFLPMLGGVTPRVQAADLAICHLEVPLAAPGGPVRNYPRFSAPPSVATALRRQGWDVCTTASNHALDQGAAGVGNTLRALDAAGVRHAGTARTPAEAATPRLVVVRGVRVAVLSYTYGFNGLPRAARHLANAISDGGVPAMLASASRARRAGAEVVVVSVHAGREYDHAPTAQQRNVARRLLASSLVDLVLGHHAHVVQPMERVHGKWVAYGLGNLIAAKGHRYADGATHEGVLPRFTFVEGAPGRFVVRAVDVAGTWIDTAGPLRVRLTADTPTAPRSRRALARTRGILQSYGEPLSVQ